MHSSFLHSHGSSGDESPTCGLGTVGTHQPFLQVFSKKQHANANRILILMLRAFIPEALLVKRPRSEIATGGLESTRPPPKVYYPSLNLVVFLVANI